MRELHRVEDTIDEDGYVVPGYTWWDCARCECPVYRYRGQYDTECATCGACYNASGQRIRSDWRGNPSSWDDEVGDLEGYEMQHSGDW